MRLSDHLGKATWSLADRGVFLAYGFVEILQVSVLDIKEWGVFLFFNLTYTIIFTLSDGFVLQSLVKFGADEKQRREAIGATMVAHLAFVGACAVVVWLLRGWLAHGFHEARYLDILWMIPVITLLTVPRTYMMKLFQMLIRTREIFLIDVAFFGTMAVMTFIKVRSHTLLSAESMISINVAGAIAGSAMGLILAIPHLRISLRANSALWKQMANFGLFQGLAIASNVIQQYIAEFMVQYYASTVEFAVYGTAKRFFKAFDAVRDATGTVIYPAVARLHAQGRMEELRSMIEKMMSFLLLLLAPVVAFCWLGGSSFVFHLFFGAKYDASIPVFALLATAGLFIPFTLNLTVLTGLGRSRTILRVVLVSSIVSVVANYLLVPRFQSMGAAVALVIAGAVTALFATRAVQESVPISMRSLLRGISDARAFLRRNS
jgi:O-antigen/teichoic acid export membrane protein